jgi:hypothetical protein
MRTLISALIIGALFVVGCGDNAPPPVSSSPTDAASDETARAASYLLTRADLPPDWYESRDPSDDSSAFDQLCPSPASDKRIGRAKAGFYFANFQEITHAVAIFGAKSDVDGTWALVQPNVDCVVKGLADGVIDAPEAKVVSATAEKLPLATIGDQSAAYRINFTLRISSGSAAPFEVKAYIEVLFYSKGAVGGTIQLSSSPNRPAADQLEKLGQQAIKKVK